MTDLEQLAQQASTHRPSRGYQKRYKRPSKAKGIWIVLGIGLGCLLLLFALIPRQKPFPKPQTGATLSEVRQMYRDYPATYEHSTVSQMQGPAIEFTTVEVKTGDPAKPVFFIQLKNGVVTGYKEWK